MQWADVINQVSFYSQQEQPDPSFTAATPTFINNAELRCYRDLQLASASGQNESLQMVAQSKTLPLAGMAGQTMSDGSTLFQPYPVIVEQIAARVGNRWVQMVETSIYWLDTVWPDETVFAAPVLGLAYFTMLDSVTVRFAPVPDLSYPLRITGQWRPAPISQSNPRTWLWDNIPDLAFAAVMAEIYRYQRDFGPGAPDPQALPEWERTYDRCLRTAKMEEELRQGRGQGWTPFGSAPFAAAPAVPP